eukprot:12250872-Alexandrium_andersonii.AAC.1
MTPSTLLPRMPPAAWPSAIGSSHCVICRVRHRDQARTTTGATAIGRSRETRGTSSSGSFG